jgi:hypothetical protein
MSRGLLEPLPLAGVFSRITVGKSIGLTYTDK